MKYTRTEKANVTQPKFEIFEELTEKFVPQKEEDPMRYFDENDIVDFQVGYLFGLTHQN